MSLKGTKTEENLKEAFAGESQANRRYLYFAQKADIEGYNDVATVYNTVHAFEKKGYLKEISIDSHKSYFDTNTSSHHHFFDEDTNQLIDCDENDIDPVNIKKNITGKKINSVEVLIKVASDNQNQK